MLSKASLGFVLAPGFRAADIVYAQAVLAPLLRSTVHFVGAARGSVRGQANCALTATATFDSCPALDVLVVGDVAEQFVGDAAYLDFLKAQAKAAKFVIGVSRGVVALGEAGLLQGLTATTDRALLDRLPACGATPADQDGFVKDGKYYTAGPSTGAIEAAFAVLRALVGDAVAGLWELTVEYDPRRQFAADAPPAPDALAGLPPLTVAVVTAPYMFMPDVIGAVHALAAVPHTKFIYAGKAAGPVKAIVGPELAVDTAFADCPAADVVVLGALRPQDTAAPELLDFLKRQEPTARAIICTCAGVLTVGAAGLLRGRRATTNFHMTHLLASVGAAASDEPVTVDGKIYSAGPAAGSYETAVLAVKDMCGAAAAQHIEQHVLEFRPQPVQGLGSPELAGRLRTAVSRALVLPLIPFYRRPAVRAYRAT